MDSIFLTLGDTALTLDIGSQQHRLPIGLATLVKAFGQHMPNALTLENAIADVEDAIMPAGRWLPAGASMLQTADPLLRQLIHSSTADPQATQASRDAISGVNLDEEAADLMRLQQAYQAASQIIATADTLFQSLLAATRR